MDLGLRNKKIAIVGGTSGMGYAVAEKLAHAGAHLGLICRDYDRGHEKVLELRAQYPVDIDLYIAAADTDPIKACCGHFSELDGLVVTAGPMQRTCSFDVLEDKDWNDFYESQLMVSVRACRTALPYLRKGGSSSIVLTAALSIREPKPTLSAYASMKSAVAALSKNLALSEGANKVRVNCIAPGAIATEALNEARQLASKKYNTPIDDFQALNRFMKEEWKLSPALGRIGKPAEVADLITFLISERASYITGALINIDGGTAF